MRVGTASSCSQPFKVVMHALTQAEGMSVQNTWAKEHAYQRWAPASMNQVIGPRAQIGINAVWDNTALKGGTMLHSIQIMLDLGT